MKKGSILIFDNGYSVEIAASLASDFEKVYYYTPWQKGSPEFLSYAYGLGIKGLEKVLHPFEMIKKVDVVAMFDLGHGDLAPLLREMGKDVFGAGEGERLEERRYDFRQLQHKIGLPTQETVRVKGVTKLREYLKDNGNKWVKIDIFRGSRESFYAKSFESAEMILDEIETAFGPIKDNYEFLCETPVCGEYETGLDAFFSAPTGWINPVLHGIEWQKNAYIGTFDDSLMPECHKRTMEKLAPEMRKLDYRGPISTEEISADLKDSYIIDITARFPFTFSASYPDWILNLPEVIRKVASGDPVTIKPVAKYVGCLPLESCHLAKHWLKLDFPSKLRDSGVRNGRIRLSMCCKDGPSYYAIPSMPVAINLVAWGDRVEQVADVLHGLVKQVDAHQLDKSTAGNLGKIMEKTKKMGWK